jgi:PIN domain nuclease of toxin-antitoxin system
MNLLLDTQVLIWSLAADHRLKSTARRAIEDGSNRVWVSAASAWEIEIKTALGKLRAPDDLLTQTTAVNFEETPCPDRACALSRSFAGVTPRSF